MKYDNDFDEMLKRSLYKVPEGFFEQVSEKTLLKAKQREKQRRMIRITLGTFAVAASLTAIAFLGYYRTDSKRIESISIVMDKNGDKKQSVRQTEVIGKPTNVSGLGKVKHLRTETKEIKPEELSDVLPELTDDELLQVAAAYKSDPFIDETQH